jgi:hypothetical protein
MFSDTNRSGDGRERERKEKSIQKEIGAEGDETLTRQEIRAIYNQHLRKQIHAAIHGILLSIALMLFLSMIQKVRRMCL